MLFNLLVAILVEGFSSEVISFVEESGGFNIERLT